MLANKLNYGDTIGVVGVANSLELGNRYDDFTRAEKLLKNKGFKIKRAKNVMEDYYGSAGTREQKAEEFMKICSKGIDFVNKMKYNEYTNIDKLIYQIN